MYEEAEKYNNPENFAKWGKINRQISKLEKEVPRLEKEAEEARASGAVVVEQQPQ